MRNFTAVYADLTPEEVAEIMANPKCRFGSHADLAAERDALAEEIAWLRVELSVEEKRCSELWELLAASQARETKLREALGKIATNTIHWYASIQDAESALALPTDDNALKEYLLENGYRQCAKGQRTTQFCGMVEEAKKQAKREALLDVIAEWEKPWGLTDGTPFIDRLRRMAGELK